MIDKNKHLYDKVFDEHGWLPWLDEVKFKEGEFVRYIMPSDGNYYKRGDEIIACVAYIFESMSLSSLFNGSAPIYHLQPVGVNGKPVKVENQMQLGEAVLMKYNGPTDIYKDVL